MNNKNFLLNIKEFFMASKTLKILAFIGFTVLLTAIISSQNFFFQSIIENGISKKDIIAQKTFTVIDVKRTEQHKKEVAQKVDYILTPAEDDFIRTNLEMLQSSIWQIRKKDVSEDIKKDEISILFIQIPPPGDSRGRKAAKKRFCVLRLRTTNCGKPVPHLPRPRSE